MLVVPAVYAATVDFDYLGESPLCRALARSRGLSGMHPMHPCLEDNARGSVCQ